MTTFFPPQAWWVTCCTPLDLPDVAHAITFRPRFWTPSRWQRTLGGNRLQTSTSCNLLFINYISVRTMNRMWDSRDRVWVCFFYNYAVHKKLFQLFLTSLDFLVIPSWHRLPCQSIHIPWTFPYFFTFKSHISVLLELHIIESRTRFWKWWKRILIKFYKSGQCGMSTCIQPAWMNILYKHQQPHTMVLLSY